MKQHFQMFAAYNRWANQRIYDAAAELTEEEYARDAGAFFKSAMGTLNHLLATDRIWMKRFTGEGDAPAALDTILHRNFEPLRKARIGEDDRIVEWVGGLTENSWPAASPILPSPMFARSRSGWRRRWRICSTTRPHHRGQMHMILTTLGKPAGPARSRLLPANGGGQGVRVSAACPTPCPTVDQHLRSPLRQCKSALPC